MFRENDAPAWEQAGPDSDESGNQAHLAQAASSTGAVDHVASTALAAADAPTASREHAPAASRELSLARKPSGEALPATYVASGAAPKDSGAKPKQRRPARLAILALVGLMAAGGGGLYGYRWWTVGRFMVTTDDAYVGAKTATLAAKVPGYIQNLAFEDNAQVHAGDTIAMIDDGDYRLAVQAARDKVATQQATVDRLGRQIGSAEASAAQARAQLVSAEAGSSRADLEHTRQQTLLGRGFASQQTVEQVRANRDQAIAAVDNAKSAVAAALANVAVAKAQQQEAARTLTEYQTALAKAERDLGFTVVRAPFDGVVGNRAFQAGDYVQTGQRLASLVPLDAVFVDANFKETQLARLKPGQTVTIAVDAAPDSKIAGTVESFAPASGSVFSLLPPDNATGNFTKIVQRVPVRIRVPAEVARRGVLRPGMSVVVSVNTLSDVKPAQGVHQVADNNP